MARRPGQTFFFIHVMKTAGTTLTEHMKNNFAPHEMYPRGDGESGPGAYFRIEMLASLSAAQRSKIPLFRGHFPFMVADEVPPADRVRMTVLRHPVERTVSLLSLEQQRKQPGRTLEEIYSDELYFKRFIENHQTKIFSMRPDDAPGAYFDPIDVDAARLELAKSNLRRVEVLGFQDRLDELIGVLRDRFGWQIDAVDDQKVSPRVVLPDAFRERIEADNAIDMEFYDYACEIARR